MKLANFSHIAAQNDLILGHRVTVFAVTNGIRYYVKNARHGVTSGGCLCGIGGSWEDESVILPCLKAPEHRHFKPAVGGWEDENANRRKNENGRWKKVVMSNTTSFKGNEGTDSV